MNNYLLLIHEVIDWETIYRCYFFYRRMVKKYDDLNFKRFCLESSWHEVSVKSGYFIKVV